MTLVDDTQQEVNRIHDESSQRIRKRRAKQRLAEIFIEMFPRPENVSLVRRVLNTLVYIYIQYISSLDCVFYIRIVSTSERARNAIRNPVLPSAFDVRLSSRK